MAARKNNVNLVDSNTLGSNTLSSNTLATHPAADDPLFAAIELFHFAFRAFTARPDEILAELGLGRVHHRILYFVGRSPMLRVSDLLATLGVSKQALHAPLRQLVDSDLIQVQADADDGRVRRLALSRKGSALEQRLSRTQREIMTKAFAISGVKAEAGWREVMKELAESVGKSNSAY